MALFTYTAITLKGKKITGKIDAESKENARIKLLRQEITVIDLVPFSVKELKIGLTKKELFFFTKELGRLLTAGLPLYEAFLALEEKYRSQKFHPLLLDILEQLRGGKLFSKALLSHPKTFDLLYVAMVANAEKTGTLEASLQELALLLEKQLKIKKQIISALIYPAMLTFFCFVVFSSLLFFVIPSLEELFEGRELHPFTQIVFSLSRFAIRTKEICIVGALTAAAFIIGSFLTPSLRKKGYSFFIRLPFCKTFFVKIALIRFSRAVAAMIEGGLPLISAFSGARLVMRHPQLEALIQKAEQKISEGAPLSLPFLDQPLIPPLIPRMLSIAEESGRLSYTFQQIAEIYEEEIESTLARFTSLIQPILLLALGALVGFVLLSVLLPLTDVSSFVN